MGSWKEKAGAAKTEAAFAVRLPHGDAARLHALVCLSPGRAVEDIVTHLLQVALDELAG